MGLTTHRLPILVLLPIPNNPEFPYVCAAGGADVADVPVLEPLALVDAALIEPDASVFPSAAFSVSFPVPLLVAEEVGMLELEDVVLA